MSEVNRETLERLITTTEQLLAALPVVASSSGETTESLINMGEIVEQGTHEELLQIKNGAYKSLYDMQFKKQEVKA